MYHRHFRAQIQSSGKINVSGSLTHQRIHTPISRPVQLTLIWFRISTLIKLFTTFGAFASFIRKVRCIKTRLDTRPVRWLLRLTLLKCPCATSS